MRTPIKASAASPNCQQHPVEEASPNNQHDETQTQSSANRIPLTKSCPLEGERHDETQTQSSANRIQYQQTRLPPHKVLTLEEGKKKNTMKQKPSHQQIGFSHQQTGLPLKKPCPLEGETK